MGVNGSHSRSPYRPYPSDRQLRKDGNRHRYEYSRHVKREPPDTYRIKREPRDESESSNRYRYLVEKNYRHLVKKEIKEEPRDRYEGLRGARSHRAFIEHSPSHRRRSPVRRDRNRRSPSPHRGRNCRSPSYSRSLSRSLSPYRKREVKQELGIDHKMFARLEEPNFWKWRREDEERECPLCKASMTGREPWNAHLVGRKHRNAVKKLGLRLYIATPEKPDESRLEEELAANLSDSEQPIAKKTSTGIQYRCRICDIPVNDLGVYKSHIEGSKHKKRKRELQKTVGLGLTDDICPACRISIKDACFSCVTNRTTAQLQLGSASIRSTLVVFMETEEFYDDQTLTEYDDDVMIIDQ